MQSLARHAASGPTAEAFSGGSAALSARTDTVVDFLNLFTLSGSKSRGTQLAHVRMVGSRQLHASLCMSSVQPSKLCRCLSCCSSFTHKYPQPSAAVDQVMKNGGNGPRLAQSLLASIAQHAPDRLVIQHADVLYHLSIRYVQDCQKWVFNFLVPVPEETLSRMAKEKIMELLFAGQIGVPPVRRKRKFKSVLEDVSKICRGQQATVCS